MSDRKTPPPQPPPTTGGIPHIHRHSVDGLSARSKDQQQWFAHDIEWKVIGPMPTQMFLDKYFPDPPDSEIEFKRYGINAEEIKFTSVPDSPGKEEEMYKGLVSMKRSIHYLSNRTNFSVTI
jgi:hypothetical protein